MAESHSDRVVIIGAGLAGIGMAVQLKRIVKTAEVYIFEKSDSIGGIWSQNTYPNLTCDIPSELYSYSFFPKPNWSKKFASQPEILEYIHDCARHFELRVEEDIYLQYECTSASWSQKNKRWTVNFNDLARGKPYSIQATILVTAMGVLSIPKGLDDLPVLKNFGGQCFHTSQWRDIDFDDKNVMVIGNGASANQVIPWILTERRPKSLVQVARSAQWMAPKENCEISEFMKWCFRFIPLFQPLRRLWTYFELDLWFRTVQRGKTNTKAHRYILNQLRRYIKSKANPDYHNILMPQFHLSAKQLILDHGYLEITKHENFKLINCDGIEAVEGDDRRTLVDKAGNKHHVDIVILANGFKTQDLLMPIKILGLEGKDLRETWRAKGGAEAYMGVAVNGFPNFFMLSGPNTLPAAHSTLHGIECSIEYIISLITRSRSFLGSLFEYTDLAVMPTAEAERDYNSKIQEKMKQLNHSSQVSMWYVNKDTGKNTLLWPDTQLSFWYSRCWASIQWSHWILEESSGK
ncbi:hypothetical protein M426DRAFT_14762 [Hypoxylon sp. CI-4A]|nr:hypothetical protein M426DRAFT_14762 [Hypoxylon sp. CI-4A]